MLRISLDNPEAGWAYARLKDGEKELLVTGPYSPVDALRDLVDAVQSLQTAERADCCWFQEPGELHWTFRRSGKEIEVEIVRFTDIGFPGQHRGEAESLFKARGNWPTFARQLLSSLEQIKTNMGAEQFERAWRHPFPTEGYEKLRNAIQKAR